MLSFKYTTTKSWIDTLDDYIYQITGDIICHNCPEGETETVGTIYAFYIDIAAATDNRVSLFQLFDSHSDAIFRFFPVLFNAKTEQFKDSIIKDFSDPLFSNLLIIDRLEIKPKYRGKDIGLAGIYNTMQVFAKDCAYVALQAFPLHFEAAKKDQKQWFMDSKKQNFPSDQDEATKKLLSYYAKLGFKQIENTAFMLLNPSQKNPELKAESFDF